LQNGETLEGHCGFEKFLQTCGFETDVRLREVFADMRRQLIQENDDFRRELRHSQEAVRWAQVEAMDSERVLLVPKHCYRVTGSLGLPPTMGFAIPQGEREHQFHLAASALTQAVLLANTKNIEIGMVAESTHVLYKNRIVALRFKEHDRFHRNIKLSLRGLTLEFTDAVQHGIWKIDEAIRVFQMYVSDSFGRTLAFISRDRSALYFTGERLKKWERREARRGTVMLSAQTTGWLHQQRARLDAEDASRPVLEQLLLIPVSPVASSNASSITEAKCYVPAFALSIYLSIYLPIYLSM